VRVETLPGRAGARLLAEGRATPAGTGRIAVRTRLTAGGARGLRHTVGGVPARVRAICRTAGGEILGDLARRRLVARVEHTRTPAGSWVPDAAVLSTTGKRFVRRLARRLDALPVARLRCDGHAAVAPASPVDAHALSLRRAQVACGLLRQSLRRRPHEVAHGTEIPIATNATEAGRAENRRVGITVVYGRSTAR
jgi:outer membrane protein OmpA-like peptidoglycan-associated protein